MNNLWILTEERPKAEVIIAIFEKFANDKGLAVFVDALRILPVLEKGKFTFTYEVTGLRCSKIDKIYIKTVSGTSSFTDFVIYYQKDEPQTKDNPEYLIEETKTDDSESRNTGVGQRNSKFVYLENYYPKAKKIMLYNLQIKQKKTPTASYVFGTRILMTLGVEILGKKLDAKVFKPFQSIDELITLKEKMRKPPKSNVPILITKNGDTITISGRLFKNGGLSHDPNIGALTAIACALRKLGWRKNIVITQHGLSQEHVGKNNKFVQIANSLNISLKGLNLPKTDLKLDYWKYETEKEKLGTIFIHLVVENFTQGYSIYENHGGCERGYFLTKTGVPLQVQKYNDRSKYKAGDKTQIVHLPDLILFDFARHEIINIEGKKFKNKARGILELKNFDDIENLYIKKFYPTEKITRTVVLYGGTDKKVLEVEVGFLLNKKGEMILGIKAPKLFQEAIRNLLDFWSS